MNAELLNDFIETYDERVSHSEHQKLSSRIDVVLMVFVIVSICLVSIHP